MADVSSPEQPAQAKPQQVAPGVSENQAFTPANLPTVAGNLPLAIAAGLGAAVAGAAIWGGLTYATNTQIGWIAIGIGFLCGFAVRFAGKGSGIPFQATGAACALIGVLLGNIFALELMVHAKIGEWVPADELFEGLKHFTGFMDFVFYAIALFCGWSYSAAAATE